MTTTTSKNTNTDISNTTNCRIAAPFRVWPGTWAQGAQGPGAWPEGPGVVLVKLVLVH